MSSLRIAAALIGTLSLAPVLSAHHSFSAEYFEDQRVVLEGTVQEFQYRNPHSILRLRVMDAQGKAQTYAAEWVGAGRLGQQGVTADTLKPGDEVRIEGSPGRTASENRIHLKSITRPADGWSYANRRRR